MVRYHVLLYYLRGGVRISKKHRFSSFLEKYSYVRNWLENLGEKRDIEEMALNFEYFKFEKSLSFIILIII